MVSLINFKTVVEEGIQTPNNNNHEMYIKVVRSEHQNQYFKPQQHQQQQAGTEKQESFHSASDSRQQTLLQASHTHHRAPSLCLHPNDELQKQAPGLMTPTSGEPNPTFVVTWRNLKFCIEPKWHQKLCRQRFGLGPPASAQGGEHLNQMESNRQYSSPVHKIVLDRLDGSFRSGELTAILGPSGAGKTTLLDCLTGHRKNGLSGSIKISTTTATAAAPTARDQSNKSLANKINCSPFSSQSQFNLNMLALDEPVEGGKLGVKRCIDKNNLKVSIIPQNDHLMGHLSVYETLSYASKMKNCFDSKFNHKANIKRIAQQLGLTSCLNNRINKLSGGQYKRVSIAQELLSSPDILILDEPTSGLDAMTCYQTIQVLRRLTDQRRAAGQKQIAVILTIHQPNSDVFQQFNHVYVVGHGGKCIYEGAPGGIESVINRIGLRLPNSYYNPATMIVEIAAGKYGQNCIYKLNAIQKKQYSEGGAGLLADEQNSTGDSAVDCPSTSACSSSGSSSPSPSHSNDENEAGDEAEESERGRKRPRQENAPPPATNEGLVNKGFVMESLEQHAPLESKQEVVVVLSKGSPGDDTDSLEKLAGELAGHADENRRKRRRRTRKRSAESSGHHNKLSLASFAAPEGASRGSDFGGDGGAGGSGRRSSGKHQKRVKLNSLKADQKFPFWRHTYLHFHRSWLSIVRDPMLCSMQLALHIIVPVMVSLVYGSHVGKPNACPRAGPMDIMAYALEPADSALQLQEELRTTLENIGYIFFKLYGIIFAAMTVTVLTFPLDMHVLVKEFRNGWYGLSSYFLGRTLADIPFQLTLPFLAMALSYYATGQPYSLWQWRFLSITAILILSSLIAQSQGLLFGAILMDRMKAAVFVAPAATTPIILFAGFLVRTQSIPHYLRPLSNLSYLRYAIEACLISRYGFNQCECDPAVFNQTVPELPPIARSMLDYWLSSFRAQQQAAALESAGSELTSNSSLLAGSGSTNDSLPSLLETTTMATLGQEQRSPDLFNKLISSLAKANSFGRNISSCERVVPYPMIDYDLKDSQLLNCFAILITMLILTRLLTFFIVCFKVKRKV